MEEKVNQGKKSYKEYLKIEKRKTWRSKKKLMNQARKILKKIKSSKENELVGVTFSDWDNYKIRSSQDNELSENTFSDWDNKTL